MVALGNSAWQGVIVVDVNGNPVGSSSGSGTAGSPVLQSTLTNRSGTITTGGTAQQAAAANTGRRYLLVQNASIGVLWISTDTTAVAGSPSIALKACTVANDGTGGAVVFEGSFIPTGAVSIIGATTGQAYTCKESS